MKIKINSEAINFFKINGFKQSKDIISTTQQPLIYCGDGAYFHINQLKKIVDAFEFVEKNNGLNASKNTLKLLQSSIDIGLNHGINDVDAKTEIPKLKQAIELVEKCSASD